MTQDAQAQNDTQERAMCPAQEWQRNGRGMWAMRACLHHAGDSAAHQGKHLFGSWRFNQQPPASVELSALCTTLQAELKESKAHVEQLESFVRAAVEVASVFQYGGKLAGALRLGDSVVIDGFKWLLAERDVLAARVTALEDEKADAWYFGRRSADSLPPEKATGPEIQQKCAEDIARVEQSYQCCVHGKTPLGQMCQQCNPLRR